MTAFNLADVPAQRRGRAWVDALNEFFYAYDADVSDDPASAVSPGPR